MLKTWFFWKLHKFISWVHSFSAHLYFSVLEYWESMHLTCLLCYRYNPVTKNVTVRSEGAVQVNFTLVRSSTDASNESKKGRGHSANPGDTGDPTLKEFEALIKHLSAENGLEGFMLSSSSDLALYRYHSYKDLSEFLRGLVMNYPHITNLTT